VVSLTLIDADTDVAIAEFDPLTDGAEVQLGDLSTVNLNVRANVAGSAENSVVFGFDGAAEYRTDNVAPYSLGGDDAGDYLPWALSPGQHTITATAHANTNGNGATVGSTYSLSFEVVDQGAGGPGASEITLASSQTVTDNNTTLRRHRRRSQPDVGGRDRGGGRRSRRQRG
jgi:hypothetical protein